MALRGIRVGVFLVCYPKLFVILRHIFKKMKAKSSSQMRHFRRFSLPDVCQLRSRHIDKFVHATEREIVFRPNCSKFAVECDWNSRNSQNVQNLGFFEKIDGFFEKNLIFFQNP